MKIEKNGKFIKVIADVGKNLYFNNSFCKVIYAPQLDTDSVQEYTDEECTEPGKVWYAPEGYHYVNKETQEDSAVETINSLPNVAAKEGNTNNIIKFQGIMGSGYNKAINTLTEEEIAVATAKGWTVTLV